MLSAKQIIPKGWVETTLGDTCELLDCLHRTPKYSNFGYPMVRVTDVKNGPLETNGCLKVDVNTFNDFSKNYQPIIGDIVFTRVGSFGLSAIVKKEEQFCIGQNTTLILAKRINSFFLFYYLISKAGRYQIVALSSGSTQPTISMASIREIQFNLPPLQEQKAIAKVLTAFDDKIELLQAQNKTLETMAQTIFKEWFGKYQIGDELPEGWSTKTLNTLCSKITDGTHSTVIDDESGHYYLLSCKNIKKGKINIGNNERKINKTTLDFLRKRTGLRKDDIVLTTVGTIGEIAMVQDEVVNFEFQRSVAIIRCNKEKILPILMFLYAKSRFFQHQALSRCLGSVQTCLFLGEIKEIEINLPSITLQKVIANNLWPLMDKQRFNNDQIQSLTKTRDTLLPKLMSGQVRINHQKLQIS